MEVEAEVEAPADPDATAEAGMATEASAQTDIEDVRLVVLTEVGTQTDDEQDSTLL